LISCKPSSLSKTFFIAAIQINNIQCLKRDPLCCSWRLNCGDSLWL